MNLQAWNATQWQICRQVAAAEAHAKREAQRAIDAQREEAAAKVRQLDSDLKDAIRLMDREPVPGLRQVIDVLCRQHRITVEWTNGPAVPGEVCAYANWHTRTITTPRIETIEDGVTALEEIGHVLQGPCPRVEPHRPDPQSTKWHRDLACERDAQERALRLVPYSPEMHRAAAASLRRYLNTTPASQDERQRARRVISGATWRELTHERVAHEMRLEQFAEMQRWAAEPRVLTRRERQFAEMTLAAKEARRDALRTTRS